jgi:hypothetical protein
MGQNRERKNRKSRYLPPVGMRMIKTAVAVFLCLVVYVLRGHRGVPIHAVIAAVICMQPYMEDSRTFAVNRVIATVVGAFYGLVALLITEQLPQSAELLQYLLFSAGVILVLYTTVYMQRADAASLASAVFLIVTLSHVDTGDTFVQVYHRVVDTLIGIGAAVLVNGFHLPRDYHRELLFLVPLEELIPQGFGDIPAGIRIGINRLIMDGAKIAIVSWRAPAFLMEKLKDLKLCVPVVVMDGAAVYDSRENCYLEKVLIPREHVRLLENWLRQRQINYFVYSIQENTLLIYYERFGNLMEEKNYQKMHKSPYRNYIQGVCREEDEIVYLRVMDTCETVENLEKELIKTGFSQYFRMRKRELPEYAGYAMLYFYDVRVSRKRMAEKLLRYAQAEQTVWTGREIDPGMEMLGEREKKAEQEHIIKRIRRQYEPIRRWKRPAK